MSRGALMVGGLQTADRSSALDGAAATRAAATTPRERSCATCTKTPRLVCEHACHGRLHRSDTPKLTVSIGPNAMEAGVTPQKRVPDGRAVHRARRRQRTGGLLRAVVNPRREGRNSSWKSSASKHACRDGGAPRVSRSSTPGDRAHSRLHAPSITRSRRCAAGVPAPSIGRAMMSRSRYGRNYDGANAVSKSARRRGEALARGGAEALGHDAALTAKERRLAGRQHMRIPVQKSGRCVRHLMGQRALGSSVGDLRS